MTSSPRPVRVRLRHRLLLLIVGLAPASAGDSTLQGYEARAQGFVYFFLDRDDEEEHTLIKADQLELEVYWRAPDETRQRIVGMRDEEALPTNIRYHLDHLTVVQDDFGDLIRLGDGDEVAAVIHPVAPGAEALYDYRLGDRSTLSYPGLPEPVRVQQVPVRPRNPELPGFVGTLYVDLGTSAIVRMAFTFTAASYVDPYLDYIRISLDNGLWMGRHWLPYRQEVELRRELPQLDFMAGSIIRGRWQISDYTFNPETADALFRGPRVTAAPPEARQSFDFRDPLYSDLDAGGLAPSEELEEIRDQARSMGLGSALEGLAPFRLYTPSVSDVIRYDRSEGWRLGAGATLRLGPVPLRLMGGVALGPERPWATLESEWSSGRHSVEMRTFWNRTVDLGPLPGASGVVNTVAALGGSDYRDLYWSSGGTVGWSTPAGGQRRLGVSGTIQEVRSATLAVDDEDTAFRPVLPVSPGTHGFLDLTLESPDVGSGAFGKLRLRTGRLDETYLRADARVGWSRRGPSRTLDTQVTLDAGWVGANAPLQELYLLGGRGTIPGFDYRGAVGDRYLLGQAWVGRSLAAPWVSVRATGALGWSELGARPVPDGWIGDPDPGVRTSLGLGLDVLWDTLRFDVARGIPGGDWSFFVSLAPRFHPWL
ncbi:MAG: hypothetical protein P8188_03535 [Gemmatimonadota bacterium]